MTAGNSVSKTLIRLPKGCKIYNAAIIAANMPNYEEERSKSSPFQNGSNQQDRRASHDGSAPPHDQLVTHFRRFIAQEQEKDRTRGFSTSPAHIIRWKLDYESGPAHTGPQTRSQAFDFWQPLIAAWDALAYDWYDPDTLEKFSATSRLSTAYTLSRQREPEIQLTRYQAGIIDALTEAAGIPHRKKQTAIAIPETVMANSKEVYESMQNAWLDMMGAGEPRKR